MRKYFVLFVTVMLIICAYFVGLNVGNVSYEDGYTDGWNDCDEEISTEYYYNSGYAQGYWDGINAEVIE